MSHSFFFSSFFFFFSQLNRFNVILRFLSLIFTHSGKNDKEHYIITVLGYKS